MLKAMWESNDDMSAEIKVFLRQRDEAEQGVRDRMVIDYPVGHRVRVETQHKGSPAEIFGPVVAHRVEAGAIEVDVENERTGHVRKFDIRKAHIRLEAKPFVPNPTQASIDAFMANDGVDAEPEENADEDVPD